MPIFEEILLEDDPTLDVHYMADCSVFDLEALGDAKASHEDALVIRRQDYMNELSNSERTHNSKMMPNSTSGYRSLISTIEEIPIDIDFNLDIDELEGTAWYHRKFKDLFWEKIRQLIRPT